VRLVVTGGGTGGHVFPALEVARMAREAGHEVLYLGSHRGQERAACMRAQIPFRGFPSEPVYSLKKPSGWKAIALLAQSTVLARRVLLQYQPNAIFSTGGYSSAPVVRAAGRFPYVLHEQNSRPGRSNLMASKNAFAVATTFRAAEDQFPGARVVRTGLPVRQELRQIALSPHLMPAEPHFVLAVGGSQGAASLNEAVLGVAQRITRPVRWLHVSGPKHFESLFSTYEKLGLSEIYQLKAFLEANEMAAAYGEAAIVIGRSGAGTLSELAAFGLPSILIPYPTAHANHQLFNAREFEAMGAAVVIEQNDLTPALLEERLVPWLDVATARESAAAALAAWDVPDASTRILNLLQEAAYRK
jgi:UDP-N-acetylglucosamine--N-acetylmuramyl-(pentapeptide) pyrophosphoryl-undecaprenol N-acetylglucosamine transferase